MNIQNALLTLGIVSVLVAGSFLGARIAQVTPSLSLGASAISVPTPYVASSTAFTLTTSSQRLLATSSIRIAATVQPKNCATDGQVFLKAQNDQPAVANSGPMVFGTTTLAFGTFPEIPVPVGSVQGITNTGTCTVVVTEWNRLP